MTPTLPEPVPPVPPLPLVPMFVFIFPADVGLIDFDNASQFVGLMFAQASAHFIAHIKRGFVRAEAHARAGLAMH